MTAATRILMLQAGSPRQDGPDTGTEYRAIREAVAPAPYAAGLAFHCAQAVRAEDLLPLLLEHSPAVVHFSGHGSAEYGLRFRTADGGDAPVVLAGLVKLLREFAPPLRLVVLSACASASLGRGLAEAVGCCVLSAAGQLPDAQAALFGEGFYRALGYGHSVAKAFTLAAANTELFGYPGELLLHDGSAEAAEALFLVPPALMVPLPRDPSKPDATAYAARTRKRVLGARPADPR
ncbi:CHAT domain-containing protein [Streptacidiphilus sp. PAMC 29251]